MGEDEGLGCEKRRERAKGGGGWWGQCTRGGGATSLSLARDAPAPRPPTAPHLAHSPFISHSPKHERIVHRHRQLDVAEVAGAGGPAQPARPAPLPGRERAHGGVVQASRDGVAQVVARDGRGDALDGQAADLEGRGRHERGRVIEAEESGGRAERVFFFSLTARRAPASPGTASLPLHLHRHQMYSFSAGRLRRRRIGPTGAVQRGRRGRLPSGAPAPSAAAGGGGGAEKPLSPLPSLLLSLTSSSL